MNEETIAYLIDEIRIACDGLKFDFSSVSSRGEENISKYLDDLNFNVERVAHFTNAVKGLLGAYRGG